jgi:ribosome-associated toxin RatA of RatAB toxin-antitoxin module
MGRMFDVAFRRFAEAFERRAAEVYRRTERQKPA